MKNPKNLKYRDIVDRIDVDAVEQAINFLPNYTKDDNDVGYCPDFWGLHKNGDTTGKFAIHRVKKVYNCFVCGGGSLLLLAMSKFNYNEIQALDWLSQFIGEHSTDAEFEDEIEQILAAQDQRRRDPILPWFNDRVIDKWTSEVSEIREWLHNRGITSSVAREFKVGYNATAMRRSSKGEYAGPAIIFPHFWQGGLVGWQERWMDDDRPKWIPKYTNTGDFPRRYTIYNYERVYLSADPIVVVESVPTVLFLASLGVPAVATFGSNVTPEQMELLRRCQQGVILAPDNDKPGEKFAQALSDYLERFIDVKVAPPVDGEGSDLGDLAIEPDLVPKVLQCADYLDLN